MPDLTTSEGREELRRKAERLLEPDEAWWAGTLYGIAQDVARAYLADAGEWRPIDSAPKDGTRVLVGWPDQPTVIGWYGPKRSQHGVNFGDAWGNGSDWFSRFETEPTHWRPLPPPPARVAAAEVAEKGADRG